MHLFCGSHPNLQFYHWKLSQFQKEVFLYAPNGESTTQFWKTSSGQTKSSPKIITSLNRIDHLDTVFISANSLQDMASLCNQLGQLINNLQQQKHVTVVVESTNFVNLEPFVKISMQLLENGTEVDVLSIMSDYDIRINGQSFEICPSKKESELIYVGRSGTEKSYNNKDIENINEIASLFENSSLDVYKLNTPLEFLSYQWKFALPKIAIEPLSILFEQPFPQDLSDQILAKPLISGLVSEIIAVIKTMGCKLFNSYDNENSLISRLSQLYPPVELSQDQREAPRLYYDFFNGQDLYLDLLLLQPILIADDHQVKTPYLEFLYAMMSQIAGNNNSAWGDLQGSSLWIRRREVGKVIENSNNEVNNLKNELNETKRELESVKNQLKSQLVSPPVSASAQQLPQQPVQQQRQIQKQSSQQFSIKQQQQQQQQQQQRPPSMAGNIKRSSTDPQYDPEMEELSELAANYSITQQTPQLDRGFERSTSNGQSEHPINGRNSPQFIPQQNLPHGLPSQGLTNGASLNFQSQQQAPIQGQQYPSQGGYSQNGFVNGYNGTVPQQQQQQSMGGGYPPNGGHPSVHRMSSIPQFGAYQGQPQQQAPPSGYGIPGPYGNGSHNGSRRSLHQGLQGQPPAGGPDFQNSGRYDTSFSSIPSSRSQQFTVGVNNGFKPTNRKNNRISQNLMAQQYGGGPANGMRHSMMPQPQQAQPILPQTQQAQQAPPAIPAASLVHSSSQVSLSKPENLVPVPEPTPSPTPVYVTSGVEEKPKKKKGGLFKFKK